MSSTANPMVDKPYRVGNILKGLMQHTTHQRYIIPHIYKAEHDYQLITINSPDGLVNNIAMAVPAEKIITKHFI